MAYFILKIENFWLKLFCINGQLCKSDHN